MSDIGERLKRLRERRGECVDCGKVPRDCECSSTLRTGAEVANHSIASFDMLSKFAGLLTETEVRAAAERYRKENPEQWQADVDNFHRSLKHTLKQAELATGLDSAANGNDVQTKLLRNPFEGTPQAAEFENGYQAAQGAGHLEINQAAPDQIESLISQGPAWRSGFAQAALSMGCGSIARQIDPDAKVAAMILSLPFDMNVKIANALGTIAGSLAGAGLGGYLGHSAVDAPDMIDAAHVEGDAHALNQQGMGASIPDNSSTMTAFGGGDNVSVGVNSGQMTPVPTTDINHTRALLEAQADGDRHLATIGGAGLGAVAGAQLGGRPKHAALDYFAHKLADVGSSTAAGSRVGDSIGKLLPIGLGGFAGYEGGEALGEGLGQPNSWLPELGAGAGAMLSAPVGMVTGPVGALAGAGVGAGIGAGMAGVRRLLHGREQQQQAPAAPVGAQV